MPVKKEGAEMSAFERKRLENMATNKAILTEISAAAKSMIPDKKPPPRSSAPRRKTVKREPVRGTRTSSRLAGLEADDEALKRKLAADMEKDATESKAKKVRVTQDLHLGDIVVQGKKWDSGVDGLKGLVRGAEPGVRTFTEADVKETTDQGLKDLRLRMGSLKLYEHWFPNGTSPCSAHFPAETESADWSACRNQDHAATSLLTGFSSFRGEAHSFCR